MGRFLFYLIAGYVIAVAVIYLFQRHLQYYPPREALATPEDYGLPGMKVVKVTTEDGLQLVGWFYPPKNPKGNIVVLYHGNAGHIGHRADKAKYFIERGYGIFLAEYRGYGGNAGSPSEQGFYRDARAVLSWLEKKNYTLSQVILYGESIGTGVSVEMAQEIQPQWLILEAPFSSAADIAKTTYGWLPVDLLLKDRYDSFAKIPDIKSNLLIIHGDEDNVIPPVFAERLYKAANHPKELIMINGGGHSDLYEHHAGHVILEWLQKHGAEDPPVVENNP